MNQNASNSAPAELLKELHQLQQESLEFESRIKYYKRHKEHELVTLTQHHHQENIDKIAILKRLVACNDLGFAWQRLNNPIPRVVVNKENWAWALWNHITYSLKRFNGLIADQRSPATKRNELKKLAEKVDEVVELIAAEPFAHSLGLEFLQDYVARKNLSYRMDRGEKILQGELHMPSSVIFGDCDNARKEITSMEMEARSGEDESIVNEIEYTNDGKYVGWHKTPLIRRLQYWAEAIQQTAMCDLLCSYSESLKEKSKEVPEIASPALGEEAKKGYLIRSLSAYMQQYYGQPFDLIVATLVTVILDIPSPGLTRDDVRPYKPRTRTHRT